MLFHQKGKTTHQPTNRTEPNQKMYTRSEAQMSRDLKLYLDKLNKDEFCTRACKLMYMSAMYQHMLLPNSRNVLLRPRFAKFRAVLLLKCDELCQEAENHKSRLGMGLETYNEYNKLIEKLIEMMMFLEDNNDVYTSSRSPTKPVSTTILLRKSARLMAKNA